MSLKSTKKVDTNRQELVITVDAEKFEQFVQKAYKKNASFSLFDVQRYGSLAVDKTNCYEENGEAVFAEAEKVRNEFVLEFRGRSNGRHLF